MLRTDLPYRTSAIRVVIWDYKRQEIKAVPYSALAEPAHIVPVRYGSMVRGVMRYGSQF